MAVKRKTSEIPTNTTEASTPENVFEWTQMKEIKLFEALLVHKPAGIAKHFNMALIYHRLSQQEGFKNMNSQNIWDHLENFFNLEKADAVERSVHDSGFSDEAEFKLPTRDFVEAMTVMNKEYLLDDIGGKKAEKGQDFVKKIEKVSDAPSKKAEKVSAVEFSSSKKPEKISTSSVLDESSSQDLSESASEHETPKTGNKRLSRATPSNSAKRRK